MAIIYLVIGFIAGYLVCFHQGRIFAWWKKKKRVYNDPREGKWVEVDHAYFQIWKVLRTRWGKEFFVLASYRSGDHIEIPADHRVKFMD